MGAVFGVCRNQSQSQSQSTQEEVTAPPSEAPRTRKRSPWVELGGEELEPALRDGLVKCLDSKYLVELSRRGEPFSRRQDMPAEAYLGLEKLKEIGFYSSELWEGPCVAEFQWLPVMIVSYAWLAPNHPDRFGETLGILAKALEHAEQHGVIIDFTALPQVPRNDAEHQTFKLGLPCLNRFYSHPHVVVLKVSLFPDGYPQSRPYDLPEAYEPVEYTRRGWCFAEAAMAGLGKSPKFVCDVSHLSPGSHIVGGSVVLPQPPMTPEKFNTELKAKKFTQPKSDVARVQDLYRDSFSERVRTAKSLMYAELGWGPAQVMVFAEAILENETAEAMVLSGNEIGADGMKALAQVLHTHQALKSVQLVRCTLGDGEAREIGESLKLNSSLTNLNLAENQIGDEGLQSIGEGLKLNQALTTLDLHSNNIGDAGAQGIGEGLKLNQALTTLNLAYNNIGNEGAQGIAEGLKLNQALTTLSLAYNNIGNEGAQGIAEGLKLNQTLTTLFLEANKIVDAGVQGIREAAGQACTVHFSGGEDCVCM